MPTPSTSLATSLVAAARATSALRIGAGLAILLAGHIVGLALHRAINNKQWVSARAFMADHIKESDNRSVRSVSGLVANAVYFLVMAGAVFAALTVVGVDLAGVFAIFASAGVVLGLAVQGILGDLMAGLVIAMGGAFKVGDLVEVVNDGERTFGTVVAFSLLNTTVRRGNSGSDVIIPNREMQARAVVNHSRYETTIIRLDIAMQPLGEQHRRDWNAVVAAVEAALAAPVEGAPRVLGKPRMGIADARAHEIASVLRIYVTVPWQDRGDAKISALRLHVIRALQDAGEPVE